LIAAQKKAGKRPSLISYDGIGHGFPSVVWGNAMEHSMAFFMQELNCRPSAP
jgi:hypothetical protein